MKRKKRLFLICMIALVLGASTTTMYAKNEIDIIRLALELLQSGTHDKIPCWSAWSENSEDYFVACDNCQRAKGVPNMVSQGQCRPN